MKKVAVIALSLSVGVVVSLFGGDAAFAVNGLRAVNGV